MNEKNEIENAEGGDNLGSRGGAAERPPSPDAAKAVAEETKRVMLMANGLEVFFVCLILFFYLCVILPLFNSPSESTAVMMSGLLLAIVMVVLGYHRWVRRKRGLSFSPKMRRQNLSWRQSILLFLLCCIILFFRASNEIKEIFGFETLPQWGRHWFYTIFFGLFIGAPLWFSRGLIKRGFWELPLPFAGLALGTILGTIIDPNLEHWSHFVNGMRGLAVGGMIYGLSLHLRWRRWVRSLPREGQENSGKETSA